MPPRTTRRPKEGEPGVSGDAAPGSPLPKRIDATQDAYAWHIVEHHSYRDITIGDRVRCTGGWRVDALRGARLEVLAHVWNLNVGKQYLRCWWPKAQQEIHLDVEHAKLI